MKIRKTILLIWLSILFTAIGLVFWRTEFLYGLPTPIPENYQVVKQGSVILIPGIPQPKDNKPVFLHFFNPTCPCSKFNITHFKALVKQYGDDVTFAIVVMSNTRFTARQIQDKFDVNIPVYFDTAIARSCGVYSTPQAVILDNHQKLYYRGNYNRSRYCTDEKSNYARQALEALLHDRVVIFNQFALKAYGCSLPNCSK